MKDRIAILERALEREKEARKQSEKILEQKSAELYELTQQLQQSNNKLHKLFIATRSELTGVFTNLVDAYVMMDLAGNVINMNDAAISMLGYNSNVEEINMFQLSAVEDDETMKSCFVNLMANGAIKECTIAVVTKSGEEKMLQINCSLLNNESNKPVAIQGIFRDITKQVEDAKNLKASENRLYRLIQHLDSGIIMLDHYNNVTMVNKRMFELFELPVADDLQKGCSFSMNTIKDKIEDTLEYTKRYNEIKKKRKVVLSDEINLKNGTVVERNYIPVFEDKVFKGHLWSFTDITLKKNFRKGLEGEKQKYSNIIANMNLGLLELDHEGKIVLVNQSFCKMTGYSSEELVGQKGGNLIFTKESTEQINKQLANRNNGISSSYEITYTPPNKAKRHWLVSGAPSYSIEGKLSGSIGVVLDITEIKNLQFQKEGLLKQLEKSNIELQEYAHIVSHDLKSPLRSIYALISWLKEDNEDKLDDVSMQNFALIEATLEKMEQLITDILDYSSAGANTVEREKVNVNDVVTDILQLIYIPGHVKVNVLTQLPVVMAERTKIQQVFQNLISNAVKFINKSEGLIEIGVEEENDTYTFFVSDNGIGIEEKYHDKIFEIFHSLNKSKDSTGIGLSIVKKIIKLYGGEVWLESTPGEGTTFYFTLKK